MLNFVNNELFVVLKNLEINESTPMNKVIVKIAFEDNNNYMKDGVLLRQVINVIDELDFGKYDDRHSFGEIYETILQSASNAGEFYTSRTVTDFITQMIVPKIGEKITDFACGTGGFLTSALKVLDAQIKTADDRKTYNNSVYGVEKKALPHLLCVTNMLLHDIDDPLIIHGNSLECRVIDYKDSDRFGVALMNPPYGGNEKESVKINFPADLRSSETADLFMTVIIYRLKRNGRAAVIIPEGFLFGIDNAKAAIKKKLLEEFNLHTIICMPHSVFAPYTDIATDILFFQRTEPTKETWIYRLDMPKGYKCFSKTKPMKLEHFAPAALWGNNREEISIDGFDKAKHYPVQELVARNYNLDLCGFSHEKEQILSPVQGKLVPQDPNDEPASVLLRRIRAEKDKLTKARKIKRGNQKSVIFRRDNSYYERLDGIERCIDEELSFEIPSSWEWARLVSFCNFGYCDKIKPDNIAPDVWLLDLED